MPVSLPFQFPSLLNFNPPGPGVPGCSNMGASPATNSGYTLAQSECVYMSAACLCVRVYRVWPCLCNVACPSLFPCLPNLFFQFSSSFSTSHPVLVLHSCHLICSWIAVHSSISPSVHLSFHLSCRPPDLFKSLQPGSQVALPPHLQLAFSGKRCRIPPAHCCSVVVLGC